MDIQALTALAEAATSQCVGDTSNVAGTGEIAEVARLVLGLPDRLVKSWGPQLHLGKIEVDGVFCHATPQAFWTDPYNAPHLQHPELCDLLIVLDDYPPHGARQRRAFLLQAKRGQSGMFAVGTGGPSVQRYMYANWPKFDLVGRPLDDLLNVQLAPPSPGQCPGSRYALVDDTSSPKRWSIEVTQAQPIIPSTSFNDYACQVLAPIGLGEALVGMMSGTVGSQCNGDWGCVVAYLLKLAKEREAENRQPAGVKSSTSGVILAHSAHASTFVNALPTSASFTLREYPFMHHLLRSQWREDIRHRSTLMSGDRFEPTEGFGVIHIKIKAGKWRNKG